MIKLTARQAEVFDFVSERQRLTGVCPSQQEIATHLGIKSTFGVRQHLRLIEKKGFLQRVPRNPRAIQLTAPGRKRKSTLRKIPLIGRIPAGVPFNAYEDVELVLRMPNDLFRGQQLFALRVRGNSMIGAGICDGDIAILNSQQEVENGQIAAILIDEDATLKRVFRSPDKVVLKAENSNYGDIVIQRDDKIVVRIVGALSGIIRSY